MKAFAALYALLDASDSTIDKLAALRQYFASADAADAAWALYCLAGGKLRKTVSAALLRTTACREAGIDDWLFDASYRAVGDLAETISHVLPPPDKPSDLGLAMWIEQRMLPLHGQDPQVQADALAQFWRELDSSGRYVLTKLVGGGFRVGVSKLLVQRALAEAFGLDAKAVAQGLVGYIDAKLQPSAAGFEALRAIGQEGVVGQPYPFLLAHALDVAPHDMSSRLGEVSDWQVEWKYDGIRAQLVRRAAQTWIWSPGDDLMTDRFPEIEALAQALPDGTVLDGEVLVWLNEMPAPLQQLRRRIGRKTLSKKLLAEAPVRFLAYDLLQLRGQNQRDEPLRVRRSRLEALCADTGVPLSPRVHAESWAALLAHREQCRARGVEGLMLKALDSRYGSGRTQAEGVWWKWKPGPLSVDCVLIYAQAGQGRSAGVCTDYTLALWNRRPRDAAEAAGVIEALARRAPPEPGALMLLPFARAGSGLSDAECAAVDKIIRAQTVERFGPVRRLRPTLVFELGFDGVDRSARHRSGIAVRNPCLLRWRIDKPLHEADTLNALQGMLRQVVNGG